MPDHLPVHVNRGERNSLEVPPSFEAADSFVIRVQNHGNAGRVHVHLDESLSAVASVPETNHYVEANNTRAIPVNVHERADVHGKVKIVSGYGATTRWVDVELTEPDDTGSVEVADELAEPQPRPDDEAAGESSGGPSLLAARPELPVFALGVLALAVAVGAATVFQSQVVALGAGVVFVAVLIAGVLLLR